MLNRSSFAPNARGLGKLRQVVAAVRPAAAVGRPAPRRAARRSGKEAEGVLFLAAILVAVCAYVLLLDRLGIPPAVVADLPLVD